MNTSNGMFGSQNQIKAQPKNLIDFIQLYKDVIIINNFYFIYFFI